MLRTGLMGRERPLAHVPRSVWLALALGLGLQIGWHAMRPAPQARAVDLPAPPPVELARLLAFGEPLVFAQALMLWLQSFDNQPGVSLPFHALDYSRVQAWLGLILELDPRGQYPLLAASRVYAEVPDEIMRRQMLDFVLERFEDDPDRRWPWLAHAAIVARHRLHDLPLALRYARAITEQAQAAPYWARDMSVILLEDMGELEAARVLIGGLLDSGLIEDAHEVEFLSRKLEAMQGDVENSSQR